MPAVISGVRVLLTMSEAESVSRPCLVSLADACDGQGGCRGGDAWGWMDGWGMVWLVVWVLEWRGWMGYLGRAEGGRAEGGFLGGFGECGGAARWAGWFSTWEEMR